MLDVFFWHLTFSFSFSFSFFKKIQDEKSLLNSAGHPVNNSAELKPENSQLPVESVPNVFGSASTRAMLPSESIKSRGFEL